MRRIDRPGASGGGRRARPAASARPASAGAPRPGQLPQPVHGPVSEPVDERRDARDGDSATERIEVPRARGGEHRRDEKPEEERDPDEPGLGEDLHLDTVGIERLFVAPTVAHVRSGEVVGSDAVERRSCELLEPDTPEVVAVRAESAREVRRTGVRPVPGLELLPRIRSAADGVRREHDQDAHDTAHDRGGSQDASRDPGERGRNLDAPLDEARHQPDDEERDDQGRDDVAGLFERTRCFPFPVRAVHVEQRSESEQRRDDDRNECEQAPRTIRRDRQEHEQRQRKRDQRAAALRQDREREQEPRRREEEPPGERRNLSTRGEHEGRPERDEEERGVRVVITDRLREEAPHERIERRVRTHRQQHRSRSDHSDRDGEGAEDRRRHARPPWPDRDERVDDRVQQRAVGSLPGDPPHVGPRDREERPRSERREQRDRHARGPWNAIEDRRPREDLDCEQPEREQTARKPDQRVEPGVGNGEHDEECDQREPQDRSRDVFPRIPRTGSRHRSSLSDRLTRPSGDRWCARLGGYDRAMAKRRCSGSRRNGPD